MQRKGKIVLLPVPGKIGVIYGMDNKTGALVPFAFSRVTKGTYFDKDLKLQEAAINVPRLDFGNYSKVAKILLEPSSTNYILTDKWVFNGGSYSILTDLKYGNDFKFTEASTTTTHRFVHDNRPSAAFSSISLLLKYIDRRYISVRFYLGDMSNFIIVDLQNKSIYKKVGNVDAYISDFSDGWLMFKAKGTGGSLNLANIVLSTSNDPDQTTSDLTFLGETKSFSHAIPQLETKASVAVANTSYITMGISEQTRTSENLTISVDAPRTLYAKYFSPYSINGVSTEREYPMTIGSNSIPSLMSYNSIQHLVIY